MKLTRRVLYNRARDMDFDYPVRNQLLAQEMTAVMVRKHGAGLSATQVGIGRRLFVMNTDGKYRECFNPKIKKMSEEMVDFPEGCLSFPGDQCIIKRPQWVEVSYQAYDGRVIEERLTGLSARCFQHELDHLDGITMWHRHEEQHAEQPRD